VRRTYRCSSGLLHRVLYEQLELKWRTRLCPWPEKVGIDEQTAAPKLLCLKNFSCAPTTE